MIVDDNQSLHSLSSASRLNNQTYFTQNYISFFNCHQTGDNSFFIKDQVFDLGYIPSNPLLILESKSYALIGEISLEQEHHKSIEEKKFLSFITQSSIFALLYNERQITVYSLSKNYFSDCKYKTITLDSQSNNLHIDSDEVILTMQTIKNEQDIPYFILVTNKSKVMFLSINLIPFNYQFSELKLKTSLVSSVFSYFYSANNGNSSLATCDILNPFSYTKMIKGNKRNNCLIVLSSSNMKMYNFDITQSITPELTLDLSIHDAILSQVNDSSQSYSILSNDAYHNFNTKVIQVTAVIKTSNYNFFLIRIDVEENNTVTYQHLNITQHFDSSSCISAYLILNKFQDEGIIITGAFIVYYNRNNKFSTECKYILKGVNPQINPESFSVDILTENNGVFNIKPSNYIFNSKEKTDEFLSRFHYDRPIVSSIKAANQPSKSIIDNTFKMNKSLLNISKPSFIGSSNMNVGDSILQNVSSGSNNSITLFLKETFNNYLETKKITPESRQEVDGLFQRTKQELLYNSIQDIIMKKINDDTLNIEIINRSDYKAEFVIVEYLEDKFALVSNFFDFLCNYDIFTKYEQSHHDILLLLLTIMEKLIVLINIRREENSYLEALLSNPNNRFIKDNDVIMIFLDTFYQAMKKVIIPSPNESKPFSKQYLYGKLSHINSTFLMNFFDKYNLTYNTCSYELKSQLTQFFVKLINSINSSLIDYHKDIVSKLKCDRRNISALLSSHKELFWCMSKVNLEENLRKIFLNAIDLNKNKSSMKTNIKDEELISYCEKMLYLYEMYYHQNGTAKDKRDFFETKKHLISPLINNQSAMKCLSIAKDFNDYYNIVYISYHYRQYDELKGFMNSQTNSKVTLFLLKLFLSFEFERINSFEVNMENYIEFDFFESFSEYNNEIRLIVEDYPKLKSFYNLYLNQTKMKPLNRNASNNRVALSLLTSAINSNDNVVPFIKLEKNLTMINKSLYCNDSNNQNNPDRVNTIEDFNSRITEEYYAIILSIIAKHFYYNLENKQVFEEIPQIIESINTKESEVFNPGERYFISFHLMLLGMSLNKLKQDYVKQTEIMIYQYALEYDYVNIKKFVGQYNAKTMENISDQKRDQINKCSVIVKFLNAFPETKQEFELALGDFYNIDSNGFDDANYINQEEKAFRLEFFNFLNTFLN